LASNQKLNLEVAVDHSYTIFLEACRSAWFGVRICF